MFWLYWTLGIVVTIIAVIDIYLAYKGGFANTISWWVWTNSVQYPIIPAALCFTCGAIVGHYWWNFEALVLIPTGALMGHFWWDQELNVTVKGGYT